MTGVWTQLPPMKRKRSSLRGTTCVHNGNVFVFGGEETGGDHLSMAEFDTTALKWREHTSCKLRVAEYTHAVTPSGRYGPDAKMNAQHAYLFRWKSRPSGLDGFEWPVQV